MLYVFFSYLANQENHNFHYDVLILHSEQPQPVSLSRRIQTPQAQCIVTKNHIMNVNKERAKLMILFSLLLSCTLTFYTSSSSFLTNEFGIKSITSSILPRNEVCREPTKLYLDAKCVTLTDLGLSKYQNVLGQTPLSVNSQKADKDQNEDKQKTCKRLEEQVQNCDAHVDEAFRKINLSFNGCMKHIRDHNVCLSSIPPNLENNKCQDEKKSMKKCAEKIISNIFEQNGLNKDGTAKN